MLLRTYKVELTAPDLLKMLRTAEWSATVEVSGARHAAWRAFVEKKLAHSDLLGEPYIADYTLTYVDCRETCVRYETR